LFFYSLGCSTISGFSSFFHHFLDFTNRNIHHAAITKQDIPMTGLTANQAIHIVKNHTTIVSHRAIMLVHTHMMFARNGIIFAKVSMNLNIAANQQYIINNQINLIIQVIILLVS
jgi:hypothetical protein